MELNKQQMLNIVVISDSITNKELSSYKQLLLLEAIVEIGRAKDNAELAKNTLTKRNGIELVSMALDILTGE